MLSLLLLQLLLLLISPHCIPYCPVTVEATTQAVDSTADYYREREREREREGLRLNNNEMTIAQLLRRCYMLVLIIIIRRVDGTLRSSSRTLNRPTTDNNRPIHISAPPHEVVT